MDQFQKLFQLITHYKYGIITCMILAKSIELYNDTTYNKQFHGIYIIIIYLYMFYINILIYISK